MNRFRKVAASIILATLLTIILVAFVLGDISGVSSALRMAGADAVVARIGGTKVGPFEFGGTQIKGRELREAFERDFERAREAYGAGISREIALALRMHEQALQRLEQRALVDKAVADAGIVVSDEMLRQAIGRDPMFQAEGTFNANRFRGALQQMRVSEAMYLTEKRREIAIGQLIGAISPVVSTPAPLRDALFRFRREKRIAETVTLEIGKMPEPAPPTEEQIKAFYDANKNRYQLPERRSISYVLVHPADVMDRVQITEDLVRKTFEERRAQYSKAEKREIDQVLVPEEDKAKAIAAAVAAGKSLEEAAKEVLARDGAIVAVGTVEKKELPPQLAEPAFSITAAGLVPPVKTPFGWHVVRVKKIEPGEEPTFEAMKATIEADLRKELVGEVLGRLVNEFDRELGKADTLAAAAEALKLKVQKAVDIDSKGADPRNSPAVAADDATADLLRSAWSVGEGKTSAVVEVKTGAFLAVHVDKVTAAFVQPLDKVRGEATVGWTEAERRKATEARAKDIADKIGAVTDLATLAAASKLDVRQSKPVMRNERDEAAGLSPAAVVKLFELKPGAAISVPSDGGATVIRLKDVLAAEPDATETQKLGKELDAAIGTDVLSLYVAVLQKRYGVTRDPAVLAQVFRAGTEQ